MRRKWSRAESDSIRGSVAIIASAVGFDLLHGQVRGGAQPAGGEGRLGVDRWPELMACRQCSVPCRPPGLGSAPTWRRAGGWPSATGRRCWRRTGDAPIQDIAGVLTTATATRSTSDRHLSGHLGAAPAMTAGAEHAASVKSPPDGDHLARRPGFLGEFLEVLERKDRPPRQRAVTTTTWRARPRSSAHWSPALMTSSSPIWSPGPDYRGRTAAGRRRGGSPKGDQGDAATTGPRRSGRRVTRPHSCCR